jgi:hypothetical protein
MSESTDRHELAMQVLHAKPQPKAKPDKFAAITADSEYKRQQREQREYLNACTRRELERRTQTKAKNWEQAVAALTKPVREAE